MTKRKALSLRFSDFREKLKWKCEIKGIKYLCIKEYYTSKVCSKCGIINEKLGGNKIFNCPICKIKQDRDINGARNIFIKGQCGL